MPTWRQGEMSAELLSSVSQAGSTIHILADVHYPNGASSPRRFGTQTITIDAQAYTNRILQCPNIKEVVPQEDDQVDAMCDLMIDDSSRYGEECLGDLFNVDDPTGCLVELFTWFETDTAGLADRLPEGRFYITHWEKSDAHTIVLTLRGGIKAEPAAPAGRIIRQPVTGAEFETFSSRSIPKGTIGKIVPFLFGRNTQAVLLPYNAGAETRLDRYISGTTGSGGTIHLDDASEFSESGSIQIGTETFVYSDRDELNDSLTISSRDGSEAHYSGEMAVEIPRYWRGGSEAFGFVYLVADHRVKSVSSITINGRAIELGADGNTELPFLIAFDDASPLKHDGKAITAIVFPKLIRISALSHNVGNRHTIDGMDYEDAWTAGAENTSISPLSAVGSDPAQPAVIVADTGGNGVWSAQFDGDLSDGASRYGEAVRVIAEIEYAADSNYGVARDLGQQMYFSIARSGEVLIPNQTDAAKLPPPQEDDFYIDMGAHSHPHDHNITPNSDDYNSTTALFTGSTGTVYDLEWGGIQGFEYGVNTFIRREVDDAFDDWWITYELYENTANMYDGNEASYGTLVKVASWDSQDLSYGQKMAFVGLNNSELNASVSRIRFVPERPYDDVTYERFSVKIRAKAGESWGAEMRVRLYVPGVGEKEKTIQLSTTAQNYEVHYGSKFTKAELDGAYIEVSPVLEGEGLDADEPRYSWPTIQVYEVWSGYQQEPDQPDNLLGADIEIISEEDQVAAAIAGVTLSNRMTRRIDLTDIIRGGGGSDVDDLWSFFSGSPVLSVVMTGQTADVRLVLYDIRLVIDYAPLINFGESVTVAADVEGVAYGDYLYSNPASLMLLLMQGNSSLGIDGLGVSASLIDTDTFSTAGSVLTTTGYQMSRAVYSQTTWAELIFSLARESHCYIGQEMGKYVMFVLGGPFEMGGWPIAIESEAVEIKQADPEGYFNRLMLFYNREPSPDTSGELADPYLSIAEMGTDVAQAGAAGVRERIIALQWHNDQKYGAGGVYNLGNKLLERYGTRRAIASFTGGPELEQYRLGEKLDLTQTYAGLSAVSSRFLARERLASHRLKLTVEYHAAGDDLIIWQVEVSDGVYNSIRLNSGRNAAYFAIHNEIVAKLDSDGNLSISGELREEVDSANTVGEVILGDLNASYPSDDYIGFGVAKAGGGYYQWAWLYDGDLFSADLHEQADLSGESVTDYYESDVTDGFRLSLNKSDVILQIEPDGTLLLAGEVREDYTF